MGIILLALIAAGEADPDSSVPFWVIISCAVFMALGTYLGGWRVIRTLGKGLVEIDSRQGMAAETSSAAVIFMSSYFGFSLSTTHVATGSVMGSGVGMPGAEVRWGVAKKMFMAWIVTLPAAGIVGWLCYWIQEVIGGAAGSIAVFVLLIAVSAWMFVAARRKPVNSNNVNDDWVDERAGAPAAGAAASGAAGNVAATVADGSALALSTDLDGGAVTTAKDSAEIDVLVGVGSAFEALEDLEAEGRTKGDAA
jgi:PiT family inorganic phosphate transporter